MVAHLGYEVTVVSMHGICPTLISVCLHNLAILGHHWDGWRPEKDQTVAEIPSQDSPTWGLQFLQTSPHKM